jgi:hypothetical protein
MIGNDMEESKCALIEVLSQHLPQGTGENQEKPIRIPTVLDKIQDKHLRNTSIEFYRYANLICSNDKI